MTTATSGEASGRTRTGAARRGGAARQERERLRCGQELADRKRGADFCSGSCRAAFHRLRAERGALLYDLFMVHRFERDLAGREKVLTLMNRAASRWRDEDMAARAGRRTWRRFGDVIAAAPWLRAVILQRGLC